MIIAAAQIKPIAHDTDANIQNHLWMIEKAALKDVDFILFPEMSLTGYEREFAETLSFSKNDARLSVFKEKAVLHQMLIIAGAPVKIAGNLHIGAFIFDPEGNVSIYTKQFLHQGEEEFFLPDFNFNPLIQLENEKISIAICADITRPVHPENASKNETTLYAASIFYTPSGIKKAYRQLSAYAERYAMHVLMANYGGPSYHYLSGGGSACWSRKGELLGQLKEGEEGLLIVEI